jgi:hypothetical protein
MLTRQKMTHMEYQLTPFFATKLENIVLEDNLLRTLWFPTVLVKFYKNGKNSKKKYTQLKTDNSLKYLSWSPKQAKQAMVGNHKVQIDLTDTAYILR